MNRFVDAMRLISPPRALVRRAVPAALLAGLCLIVVAMPGRSDDKEDIQKIEKQIAELKLKLDAAKGKTTEVAKGKGDAGKPAVDANAVPVEGTIPADVSKVLSWRNVGPANMGGRITSLAVYDADPTLYYVATASGGLLKTVNNGTTFTHLFDDQSVVSIGHVAVCQTNPDLVWVGTGEANPRNSVSYGNGVYKSTDGGKTWANMGLKSSFQIGKVLIHPKNPDVVYVGALGRLYGPGGDRGVWKTEDGGKTWNNVYTVDNKTGVIDMMFDPNNPDIILAAFWEHKRDEFDGFFGTPPVPDSYGPIVTHGAAGGIFRSTDAGKTWTKINDPKTNNGNGLPTVKTGRIGFEFSRKTKGLMYAIVDSELVGTGDAPKQVYMGIVGETVENMGAKLTEITPDSPASKAGLKADDLVTDIEGKKIESYDAMIQTIQEKVPGDKLKLSVTRGDMKMTIEVTLENRPGTPTNVGQRGRNQPTPDAPTRPLAGVTLAAGTKGALVAALTPAGGAEKAGLKADDEITMVEGKPVKNQAEFAAAIGTERKVGDTIKVTVVRGTETKEYSIVLQAPATIPATRTILAPGILPEFTGGRGEGDVKIGTVAKDSAAEKAGIKVGDVIVEIDGKKLESLRDYTTLLRTSPREDNPRKAGDKIKLRIKQGEKTLDVELALIDMPAPGGAGGGGGGGVARGPNPNKPYLLGLGGQQPNAIAKQGKNGYQTGGVYQSTDSGATWNRINSVNPRPMYFSVVRIDPSDDKTLYVLGDTTLWKSTDGGKSFKAGPSRGVHADYHDLWINAKNGKHQIIGCDGGFYATYDAGAHWDHLNHLALGQFYHVATDNKRPYNIYGGLQDNGSWGGPSNTARSYGPVNEDWVYVSGGDGFVCRVDPTDPDLIYTESQGGAMSRRNFRTGQSASISPPRRQADSPLRFNWNTPFILSYHNPSIFYAAGEYVWRSVKKGSDLRKISPEITRTKAGSGTALSESPMNPDVVWAGTDDGFVWITRDNGTTWTNVTEAIKAAGVPGYRWVSTLEASRDKEGRCYVCLDAHRSDDDKPYVLVTEDFGKTFKSVVSNLPAFGSTRCLREDIVNQDVLYCGTEFGAFVSANKGLSWTKLGGNLPTVAVHEFAQPTVANEIVVGTHGRSVWILDITSIRQMKPDVLKAKATLFAPSTAVRWRSSTGAESPYSASDRKFAGSNPPRGATIEYLLTKPAEKISVKIVDVTGKTVNEFVRPPKTVGLHQLTWSLASRGAGVKPGVYRVVMTADGTDFTQSLTVELDPNAAKDVIAIDEGDLKDAPVNPLTPIKAPLRIDD